MVDLPSSKVPLNFVTTTELKSRPMKTSLGVLPVRRSESIPELNLVHLRGRSVNIHETENENEVDTETGHIGANTPRTPRRSLQQTETQPTVNLSERREPLPAILPVVGTAHTAVLQTRQSYVKPVVRVPPVRKRKVDVVVIEREALQRGTPRSIVDKMVQEARMMSHSGGDRGTPYSRISSKQQSYGATSSASSHLNLQQNLQNTTSDDPSRTVVENLIASIKSKQLQEAQRQSDRKIVEIIHRVLGRTIDLVYDDDELDKRADIERARIAGDQATVSMILEEDDKSTVTLRGPDISRADLEIPEDDVEDQMYEEEEEQIRTDGQTIDATEESKQDEEIDMSRDPLYRHILLGISNEDILNVQGTRLNVTTPIYQKNQAIPTKTSEPNDKSIHHFCIEMLDESDGMPREIRAITQLYHQRARFKNKLPSTDNYYKHGQIPNYKRKPSIGTQEPKQSITHVPPSGTPSIPYDGLMSLETDLSVWQIRATELVQPQVIGNSAISTDPYLVRLWTPAPPKMYVHPRRVKERLFAQYISPNVKDPTSIDEDEDENEKDDETFPLSTTHATFSVDRDNWLEQRGQIPVIRPYKSLERLPSSIDQSVEFRILPRLVRSFHSSSNLTKDSTIRFDTNFAFTLEETKHQMANRKTNSDLVPPTPTTRTSDFIQITSMETFGENTTKDHQDSSNEQTLANSSKDFKYFPKKVRSAVYHRAKSEGRKYIDLSQANETRRIRKDAKFWQRIDAIVELARAPPRMPPIERRNSFHEAFFYERIHPHVTKQRIVERRSSFDRKKHSFDERVKEKYNYQGTRVKSAQRLLLNEFQWTRELWYQWLDDYIAELDRQETLRQVAENKVSGTLSKPSETSTRSVSEEPDDQEDENLDDSEPKKIKSPPLEPIVNLMLPDSEDRRILEEEIHRLTSLIERNSRDVFSLTRRGGLLRKLGLFQDALNDLSLAVYIEPCFMDAHWQRALIYMIFEHYDQALESLNLCVKYNKTHAGAYKLRGDIYALKNDLALAIANYSQAVRYNPTDHEAFFQRAETYERRNEILLAMDDYVQVTRLNPKNIEAWHKHGMYYFNTKNYDYAIGDFTELLKRQMNHVSARLHRGLSFYHLEDYQAALADFSATLHYDPSNWAAYYHRGCLLRTCNPSRALQDFSISLLINPEYENLGSYLHRALIYCHREEFDEAIADYEAILVLDREHAPALCNLAIIYMKRNTQKALDLFTRAIEAEPTYVRAYFCRAYFYGKINELQKAYSDYTKIYHMFPDQNAAMVLRGNMLLAMGKLDWASFCVEAAAKLQSAATDEDDHNAQSSAMKMSASSPQQQAIVHSFLEHYDHALGIMERECFHHPTASNFRMLGKLRVKAKRFDQAREAFEKCIQACSSNPIEQRKELYGAHLDLSKCLIQLKLYVQAIDQLSVLIKLQQHNPNAQAYLQRGIAKMRMFAHTKASDLSKLPANKRPLLDINRALVIEPNSAEAYLARAAWYARCERYSKAVLNCNEAIRLSPNLVRAYLYRGCLKYSLRLYNHAINDLSKALEIDPSCSHAYYNRALCQIRTGNLSNAAKDFAIVLSLASMGEARKTQLLELETYVNRGLVHYEHKDFENAIADFEKALDLVLESTDHSQVYGLKYKLVYTIGQCHHRLAEFSLAIKRFEECQQSEHTSFDASFRHDVWIALGNSFMEMKGERMQITAARYFEKVLHENPLHEQARLNLGYCLRQRALFQRAWTQFSSLLHIHPNHVQALEARAIVCLQMNHPNEAFIDLNQALRFQPSSAQLLTNRGVVLQYLGNNQSAMSDYRAAVLIDPRNAFAHYNIGNILMFHGQFLQAISSFSQVLEINPRDEAALTNRAIAKAILKQYQSAREDLECAIRISPLSGHIHVDLGQLLLTMDEPILAEQEFTRALEIRPCDPAVFKWRADARSKQGKHQEALNDYRACVELNDAIQMARKYGLIKGPVRNRRRL